MLSSATTVDEARWLEAHGVDAIIAQGLEAGGHRGMFLSDDVTTQIGTFALVPQIVAAVKVPVIAAGGIADANGVAAAMALGAAGVQVGTAYLLCPEATTSAVHRAALKSAAARHTALTNVFTGRPARGIVNRIMRELGPISAAAPEFPLATAAIAPAAREGREQGRGDFSPLWSGQNASGCREIPAAISRASWPPAWRPCPRRRGTNDGSRSRATESGARQRAGEQPDSVTPFLCVIPFPPSPPLPYGFAVEREASNKRAKRRRPSRRRGVRRRRR